MHLCLPRKVHGRLNSFPATKRDEGGNEGRRVREKEDERTLPVPLGEKQEGGVGTHNARFYALA